jgi:hypothetical protein
VLGGILQRLSPLFVPQEHKQNHSELLALITTNLPTLHLPAVKINEVAEKSPQQQLKVTRQ